MKSLVILSLASCILLFPACEKTTNPISTTKISLTAEYVGVTEAELRLRVDSSKPYDAMQLQRDGQTVYSMPLSGRDTTLLDTTLLPAHTYVYRMILLKNTKRMAQSEEIGVTTMDTTSHDFQWEIFEIPSPYGSGMLRDVAIINENDIWAVGEIYADGVQNWLPYNAVHWDGNEWELIRIKTNACGGVDYPPIKAVFSFSSNDVLFAHIDGSITHYDGRNFINDCSLITQLNGSVIKMWGICRNDLIVVSGNGFLAYYNGSSWQKLDSGTDLPIQDIWGAIVDNDKIRILCTASEKYNTSEKKLLEVDPITNEVEEFEWPFQDRRIHSVWFNSSHQIWICGAGVFVHKHSIWKEYGEVPLIFTNRIRGLDINDIFVVGDFGLVAHYNGLSWKVYPEVNFALYTSLDFKEDFMMAAGQRNGKGYILKMSR